MFTFLLLLFHILIIDGRGHKRRQKPRLMRHIEQETNAYNEYYDNYFYDDTVNDDAYEIYNDLNQYYQHFMDSELDDLYSYSYEGGKTPIKLGSDALFSDKNKKKTFISKKERKNLPRPPSLTDLANKHDDDEYERTWMAAGHGLVQKHDLGYLNYMESHGHMVQMNDDVFYAFLRLISKIYTPTIHKHKVTGKQYAKWENGKEEAEEFRVALKKEAYILAERPASTFPQKIWKLIDEQKYNIARTLLPAGELRIAVSIIQSAPMVYNGVTTFLANQFDRGWNKIHGYHELIEENHYQPFSLYIMENWRDNEKLSIPHYRALVRRMAMRRSEQMDVVKLLSDD